MDFLIGALGNVLSVLTPVLEPVLGLVNSLLGSGALIGGLL